jgi:pyrroline-5-carboxylate reductase
MTNDLKNLASEMKIINDIGELATFILAESLGKAAVSLGVPEDFAKKIAVYSVYGSGYLLETSKEDASTLREQVTSPGGTTEAALKVLMPAMQDLIIEAVNKGNDK